MMKNAIVFLGSEKVHFFTPTLGMVRLLLAGVILFALLVCAAAVYAQGGADYDLSWSTIDGGGSTTTTEGGDYILMSTAGQSDAGPVTLEGGGYSLTGGFWPSGAADSSGDGGDIYLPVIMK